MIPEKEKNRILYKFNKTQAEYPDKSTIHQLFEEQVSKTPGSIAVIFGAMNLTYRELNEKANQLARLLISKGCGSGQIAAVMVERSPEMIIGLLGILKSGGAYLPISPGNPVKRIDQLLEDSGVEIALIQRKFTGKIDKKIHTVILGNDEIWSKPSSNLSLKKNPGDAAYVIYTSGSTGKPKGVLIEHRSVVNRLNWMQKKYPISGSDTILQKTPFTFDVSVWELFWWAMVGAKLCFLDPGLESFPQALVKVIEEKHITVMHFVPSMLSPFFNYLENSNEGKRLASLKFVFSSGEPLSLSHLKTFYTVLPEDNPVKLINLYGPTEATVDVTYFDCSAHMELNKIPIGRPIDNIKLLIIQDNRLQPVGSPGELCILGDGLARGYLNRVELTADRFVDNTFFKGERMYKTGDLVSWQPDGNIEFLGRMDQQVKIHGIRIELQEIESVLSMHPLVRESVVVVKKFSENITMLTAFIVSEENISLSSVKKYLDEQLPGYMIPKIIKRLDRLPLTKNGKVDRGSLQKLTLTLE